MSERSTGTGTSDWARWPERYDVAGGVLARRLELVQRRIRDFLAGRTEPVRVLSLCAGDGRDLLGVLAAEPMPVPVIGRLIELDPANADAARVRIATADIEGIEVVTGDAAVSDAYAGAVPADLVLVCGIFGNVVDEDIRRTIATLPQLCARGATAIWTRHRRAPDLTPSIRRWCVECAFEEVAFESTPSSTEPYHVAAVGTYRWPHDPEPLERGKRLFTFFR